MPEIISAVISMIAGFLIALYSERIRSRLEATSIKISFDKERDILTTPDDEHEFGTYIKIKLENTGSYRYARQISCHLTSIDKKNDDDKWKTIYDIPLGLVWSYIDNTNTRDLAPKMWTYFNVFNFNKGENKIIPAVVRKPYIWRKDLEDVALYRFNIFITGLNINKPIKASVILKWNGLWDNFEIVDFTSG
jgi:hypothetical protein